MLSDTALKNHVGVIAITVTHITIQRLWENDNTYNERVSHITNEYVEKLLAVYVGCVNWLLMCGLEKSMNRPTTILLIANY